MTAPFDSILVLSFGGPDGPDDVRPFLENVTRGRGIPPERLDAVAEHYLHFGGVSPINRLNLDIIDRLRDALRDAGVDLPVFFGNRNWHPMISDTVEDMYDKGFRRTLVFPTSAWGGFSGCGQYHDDIRGALDTLAENHDGPGGDLMELRKLPHYWDRPEMTAACADAITDARERLPSDQREGARLVFTAHSIPDAADAAAGPPSGGGHLYSRQVAAASDRAAAAAGFETHDLVWQSRSGPPRIPWLEPDISDHLETLAARSRDAVIVCPIGFVSDHLEVVWDLDTEAAETAERLRLPMVRAATVGVDARFIDMIVSLISAQIGGLGTDEAGMGCTDNGARCAPGCCVSQRPSRPAA